MLAEVAGTEHWTIKRADGQSVKLFLWRKSLRRPSAQPMRGTVLFVHGSSVPATPVFDLQIAGKPEASTMDWFARLGYDTWCVDCEGYGRSDKSRASERGRLLRRGRRRGRVGIHHQAKRRREITVVRRLVRRDCARACLRNGIPIACSASHSMRSCGPATGVPRLAERKKRLAEFRASNRRPIDRAFVHSIFTRDHPGTSDLTVVDAFADAVLALDTSVPTGTYIDMSANLPVVDPTKITVPTLVMRGQWDGIASFEDVANFFAKLPNPDKQFIVMPGIAHTSTRSKNWALVYHLLDAYFSQPAPVYVG